MTTLVTFLLDRSGSMQSIKEATIGAFNAYLDTLKKEPLDMTFSLLTFDTHGVETVCKRMPVRDVAPLDDKTYQPRAGTPLIDAAYDTITALEAKVKEIPGAKVVVCIQTDGEENESRRHSWEELQGLIQRKQAEGWQFNFMGAGIDAYQQATRMGIATAATMSYDKDDAMLNEAAFVATASNTASFAAGRSASTSYSTRQKMAAGDKFDPLLKKAKQGSKDDIDL